MFERKTLCLGYTEVGEDGTSDTGATEDEEDLGSEVAVLLADEVRVDGSDDAVPKPVGGGREGNTTGSDGKREDLSDDDPRARTPGGGEEGNEDADESNLGAGQRRVCARVRTSGTNRTGDEQADNHADGSVQEKGTTTVPVNEEKGDWCGSHVYDGGGDADGKRVTDQLTEELRSEVEDEVDTRPLLEHLQSGTKDGTTNVGTGVEYGATEAVTPRGEVTTDRDDGHFVLVVGDDLGELVLHKVGVGRLLAQAHEGLRSRLEVSTLDKVPGRFREEEKSDGEDDAPQKLDTHGDTVRTRIVPVLGGVGHTTGYGC